MSIMTWLKDGFSALVSTNEGLAKGVQEGVQQFIGQEPETCSYYDSLCRFMGVESGWHSPEWFQDSVKWVSDTTGLSPDVASVAFPAVTATTATFSALAIYKLLKKSEKILTPELFEEFKGDPDALKFFKELKKNDRASFDIFMANPGVAKRLAFRSENGKGRPVYQSFANVGLKARSKAIEMMANDAGVELVKAPVAEVKKHNTVPVTQAKKQENPSTSATETRGHRSPSIFDEEDTLSKKTTSSIFN